MRRAVCLTSKLLFISSLETIGVFRRPVKCTRKLKCLPILPLPLRDTLSKKSIFLNSVVLKERDEI